MTVVETSQGFSWIGKEKYLDISPYFPFSPSSFKISQLIRWGDGQQHAECSLKQQGGPQSSWAGLEGLCPCNEFLTADVTEKRSRSKQYHGRVMQVESVIISLMIMSQLQYIETEWLGKKVNHEYRQKKKRQPRFFFFFFVSSPQHMELFLYFFVSLNTSFPFIDHQCFLFIQLYDSCGLLYIFTLRTKDVLQEPQSELHFSQLKM